MKKIRATKTAQSASIVNGVLFIEDARQCAVDSDLFPEIIGDGYTNTIRLISLDVVWYTVEYIDYDSKVIENVNMQLTMRREVRHGRGYWYAYRRVLGTLYKRYIGNDDQVTQKRLLEVAKNMPGI